ncbi:MAG: putative zinc-binding peptidase [Verrucomicrobiales bacterium]|nr:putative zinc-binding peptidase [Verrucomicrobiales bacterium]
MKTFACGSCGGVIFFENDRCVRCGHTLGFLPAQMELATFTPFPDGSWSPAGGAAQGRKFQLCSNGRIHSVCNWYLEADDPGELCYCCRLNLIIPDLSVAGNLEHWHQLEIAKRRLVYSLLNLSLPTSGFAASRHQWPALRFQFMAQLPGGPPVPTAHQQGVITVDLAEADPVERERRRKHLHEPQRTLLGHFRHESGHYYWGALIAGSDWAGRFRALFGDETAAYDSALGAYYANGPSPGWEARFISAYASSHPWEDWAETWAHYLHMIDLIETGQNYRIHPEVPEPINVRSPTLVPADPGQSFDEMLDRWFPLVAATNSLNRSMGLPDLYPYVMASTVIEKIRFVHELVKARSSESRSQAAPQTEETTTSPSANEGTELQSATTSPEKPHSAPKSESAQRCVDSLMP